MVACESCASIMKKCVQCRTNITEMIPLSVCCGGQGTISKISIPAEEKPPQPLEIVGTNNAGINVAMNNTTPVANNTADATAAGLNLPGGTTNNLNLVNDVQRLQQQLQDIKEQVSFLTCAFIVDSKIKFISFHRQCAPFVSIEFVIWSSFVDMVHVKCVVIKSKMDAQFVVRKLKNASYFFKKHYK